MIDNVIIALTFSPLAPGSPGVPGKPGVPAGPYKCMKETEVESNVYAYTVYLCSV